MLRIHCQEKVCINELMIYSSLLIIEMCFYTKIYRGDKRFYNEDGWKLWADKLLSTTETHIHRFKKQKYCLSVLKMSRKRSIKLRLHQHECFMICACDLLLSALGQCMAYGARNRSTKWGSLTRGARFRNTKRQFTLRSFKLKIGKSITQYK